MAEPATRHCPDCATKMREYRVGSVEVDRCPKCLGMWFDWGELEQAIGRSLEPELFDGHTERRCAFCRITLRTALLPGVIPVETCTSCRGIFLDAGELGELGGHEPSLPLRAPEPERPEPERPEPPPRSVNTFACAKCGLRYPMTEGNATARGLMCRRCAPQPHPGRDGGGRPLLRTRVSAVDILAGLLDFFR